MNESRHRLDIPYASEEKIVLLKFGLWLGAPFLMRSSERTSKHSWTRAEHLISKR